MVILHRIPELAFSLVVAAPAGRAVRVNGVARVRVRIPITRDTSLAMRCSFAPFPAANFVGPEETDVVSISTFALCSLVVTRVMSPILLIETRVAVPSRVMCDVSRGVAPASRRAPEHKVDRILHLCTVVRGGIRTGLEVCIGADTKKQNQAGCNQTDKSPLAT